MTSVVPDLLSSAFISRVTTDLRNRLDTTAIEAVTGRRSDVGEATAGRTGQVLRTEKTIAQSDTNTSRLSLLGSRYDLVAQSYSIIRTGTENVVSDTLTAMTANDRAGRVAAAQSAQSSLEVVFSALNARFDGRSVFSGAASDVSSLSLPADLTSAVAAIAAGPDTLPDKQTAVDDLFGAGGLFETTIYQGSTTDANDVRLPDGAIVPAPSRADDPAVRDLLKGLSMIAVSDQLPEDEFETWTRTASDLVRSGRDQLAVQEAALGDIQNRIDRAREQQLDLKAAAQESLDGIIGVDAFEAASEARNLETRLQAAYTLTSRLSGLSLVNFLR